MEHPFDLAASAVTPTPRGRAVLCVWVSLPGAVGASESVFLSVQGLFFGPLALPAMLLSRGLSFYGAMALSALVTAVPAKRGA